MRGAIIALAASYVALGILVGGLYAYSRGAWWLKTLVAGGAALLYATHYVAVSGIAGWPAWENPPPRFRLLAAQIYEPNPVTGWGGAIYMWTASMEQQAGFTTPRAYTIRYDEELHRKLNKAMSDLKNGRPQVGEISEKEGDGPTATPLLTPQTASQDYQFYDLPARLLPEK